MITLDDARVRKISAEMPVKMRKHSANLLQQQHEQQQQQHNELRRQVLSLSYELLLQVEAFYFFIIALYRFSMTNIHLIFAWQF